MRANARNVVLVGFVLLVANSGAAGQGFEEIFDQSFALAPGGAVGLENINGDVSVEVWERSEVRVYAVKKASSQELLDGLKIDVEANGNAVQIETRYPSSRRGHDDGQTFTKVEYTLSIPRQADVDDIELVNGNLTVVGVEGSVQAESVNGTIVVRDGFGNASLSTVNGGIELYAERLGSGDSVDLESVNGTVNLFLGASAGADVRAETVNGEIRNDFGLHVNKHKYVGADLRGTIGGGGARVDLETVNGGITVHSR
jgi:DUF4097 and DUF4098 domain-containing protein YvlB